MHFSAVVFYVASIASAYTILRRQTDLPPCAQTCYTNTSAAPCNATDIACQCLNENFVMPLAQCVTTSCSAADAQTAEAAALAQCKTVGVDLTASSPFPACAAPCDQQTTSAACPAPTDPNATPDVACYCKDTTYIQTMNTCFKSSCTGQDLTNAVAVGEAFCRAHGVDISPLVAA
ncbi:hypothetical protein FS837_005628 [Tulasnella sp. UAMH 9824]|nr:hypothetical protein FS837_005628 [Tulasnella sp. UAMH 9824]